MKNRQRFSLKNFPLAKTARPGPKVFYVSKTTEGELRRLNTFEREERQFLSLISLKQIARINLLFHVTEHTIVAIGNNGFTTRLERF